MPSQAPRTDMLGSASRRRAGRRGGSEDGEGETGEGTGEVFLDTDEQAKLIAELRRKGQEQNRSTRVGYG